MVEVSNEITCKNCGSTNVVKFGTYKGVQRYWCKACKRKFMPNNALPKMKPTTIELNHAFGRLKMHCKNHIKLMYWLKRRTNDI